MNKCDKTIGWADYTWNPITGCLGDCEYCYARRIYKRFKMSFKPAIRYDRISEPFYIRKPSRIFVCSVADFYGVGVEPLWQAEVFNVMRGYPEHQFFILTKRPDRINTQGWLEIPYNCTIGVSITTEYEEWRLSALEVKGISKFFVSAEPLLGNVAMLDGILRAKWIIVGGLTPKPVHKEEWVDAIVERAMDKQVPIFLKDNLHYPIGIRSYPI